MGYWFVNLFCRGKNGDFKRSFMGTDSEYKWLGRKGNNKWIPGQLDNSTQPLIEPLANIFHALLTGKYLGGTPVEKIMFVTPIRVLSFEQAEGFQAYFLDLIIFLQSLFFQLPAPDDLFGRNSNLTLYEKLKKIKEHKVNGAETVAGHIIAKAFADPSLDQTLMKFYNVLNDNKSDTNLKEFDKWAREYTRSIIAVKTGGGSGDFTSNIQNAIVIVSTYGSAANFIAPNIGSIRFIVFDESHLYQPSDMEGNTSQSSEAMAAKGCYIILKAALLNQNTQIAFLSGTINPQSARNFKNYINKKYARSVKVEEADTSDPQAKNKTELKVIPADFLMDMDSLAKEAAKWIRQNSTGHAIIVFSKVQIARLLEEIEKKVSPIGINSVNERSNINRAQKERIDEYRSTLRYSGLRSDEIDKKVQEFIAREFPESQAAQVSRIQNKPGASEISNTQLRTAVSYGIGYIYTQDPGVTTEEDRAANLYPVSEKDKMIVANLFSTGKINVLLATSSIGVGVNVSIKSMYLSNLAKRTAGKDPMKTEIEWINKRELSQLLNRTGRGVIDSGLIYVPHQYVDYVREVINMTNKDYNLVPGISTPVVDFSIEENLMNVLISLHNAVDGSTYNRWKQRSTIGKGFTKTGEIISRAFRWARKAFLLRARQQEDFNQVGYNNLSDQILELCQRVQRQAREIERQLGMFNRYTKLQTEILASRFLEGNGVIPFDNYLKELSGYRKCIGKCIDDLNGQLSTLQSSPPGTPNRNSLIAQLQYRFLETEPLYLKICTFLVRGLSEGMDNLIQLIGASATNQDEYFKLLNLKIRCVNSVPDNVLKSNSNLEKFLQDDLTVTRTNLTSARSIHPRAFNELLTINASLTRLINPPQGIITHLADYETLLFSALARIRNNPPKPNLNS